MWTFLLISTLAWGIAEIFYKKGNLQKEKYSHLKTTVFVGFFMGIYALVILFTQGINLSSFPLNLLYYFPVAFCYILSMVCSYFGVRFLEESIADPIENCSGAVVAILCAIFLKETMTVPVCLGITFIVFGLLTVGFLDRKGTDSRVSKYGKCIAFLSIAMPFCYMIFDAIGTFLDIFYTNDVSSTLLVNVNENNLEHTANCAYELIFFLFSICILIFLKVKKVKFFSLNDDNSTPIGLFNKIKEQKWKLFAAFFEMIGQATYLFALSSGTGIAAVIIGAGTVIVSLFLSIIFLKEKLTTIQIFSILVILVGIITISIYSA